MDVCCEERGEPSNYTKDEEFIYCQLTISFSVELKPYLINYKESNLINKYINLSFISLLRAPCNIVWLSQFCRLYILK